MKLSNGVIELANKHAKYINEKSVIEEKKKKGQYFTSAAVSQFMASLCNLNMQKVRLLDPGSGVGTLVTAIIERIVSEDIKIDISVDLYENDFFVYPYLKEVMENCKLLMENKGNSFDYKIFQEDFILYNAYLFNETFKEKTLSFTTYDLIISNPPYFKVQKNHIYSQVLREYVFGQPNVYFMFMAVAEKLLKPSGQLIFLTPRSYCSGLYFKKFRRIFFKSIQPHQFHVFSSRKNTFVDENILQENIILNGYKDKRTKEEIIISTSYGGEVSDSYKENKFESNLVLFNIDGDESVIRLPILEQDEKVLKLFDSWDNTLEKMGMNISTGPVVTFRARDAIKSFNEKDTYPLLYMKHVNKTYVQFPLKGNKEEGIIKNFNNKAILITAKNYVIVKRFSSKEQDKRIYASGFLKEKYSYERIGLENHLNYIYKKNDKELSTLEVIGLVSFLNSQLVNKFFCIINGHTQVNASDLKVMKFPDYNYLLDLGREIEAKRITANEIDDYINKTLVAMI